MSEGRRICTPERYSESEGGRKCKGDGEREMRDGNAMHTMHVYDLKITAQLEGKKFHLRRLKRVPQQKALH